MPQDPKAWGGGGKKGRWPELDSPNIFAADPRALIFRCLD